MINILFYLQEISPKAKLEIYFIKEVVKRLDELDHETRTRRVFINEITENTKDTLIAASVVKKQLFREVLDEYYIGRPTIELIEDIVKEVYKSDKVEAMYTKLNGGVPVDFKRLIPFIEFTAKVLNDIVNLFIKPKP